MKKFQPKPGQVDFTNIRYAPVANCVLFNEGKILLVKRSDEVLKRVEKMIAFA